MFSDDLISVGSPFHSDAAAVSSRRLPCLMEWLTEWLRLGVSDVVNDDLNGLAGSHTSINSQRYCNILNVNDNTLSWHLS